MTTTTILNIEIFSESSWNKPNFDCNYFIQNDLTPNGITFDAELIRKTEKGNYNPNFVWPNKIQKIFNQIEQSQCLYDWYITQSQYDKKSSAKQKLAPCS